MTYPFPPPEWFGTGTISRIVLLGAIWIVVLGMPASVCACWYLKPRSRVVWGLATLFWGLSTAFAYFMVIPYAVFPFGDPPRISGDPIPEWLGILMVAILVGLPFPALIGGLAELVRTDPISKGFYSVPTWIGAGTVALVFMLTQISVCIYPREAGWRSQCRNQLKQIGLAFHNYADYHENHFPDAAFQDEDSPPRSWRVDLLPYVDQQYALKAYDPQQPWDSAKNLPLAQRDLHVYTCPSVPPQNARDAAGRYFTSYATLIGPETVFPNGRALSFKQITDGTSNTALVVEACGQQIVWTEPRDIQVTAKNLAINLPGDRPGYSPAAWSSYHRRMAQTLCADGSVRNLSTETDPSVLKAIMTAHGGKLERP